MTASAAEPTPAPAAAGPPWKVIAFSVVALLAGAGIGTVVVAPKLRGGGAAAHATAEPKKEKEAGPPRMIKLENLIVNPAGTQGAHFLILTIGFQVSSAAVETRLHDAEVPLRDAVTDLLARMTMDQLAQPGIRDTIRRQLGTLAFKFAQDSAVQVFLPQFLIQ